MARDRKVIDGNLFHINRHFAYGLHCVTVKKNVSRPAALRDFFDRKKNAGLIIRPHKRNDSGFIRDCIFQVRKTQ